MRFKTPRNVFPFFCASMLLFYASMHNPKFSRRITEARHNHVRDFYILAPFLMRHITAHESDFPLNITKKGGRKAGLQTKKKKYINN